MPSIITLTTDFGLKDAYLGAMKGSILSIDPHASIVDISHQVSPGDILEGALILLDAYSFFPEGAIHVAVVDPGVGTKRMPILMETNKHYFIAPDNGLLSLVARREKVKRYIHLTNGHFFLDNISRTFHGRDIFGPVAAHLSKGVAPGAFGPEIGSILSINIPAVEKKDGSIHGEVVYIDSFGNLITNIEKTALPEDPVVEIKGVALSFVDTYGSIAPRSPAALISSSGHLEIAVNSGSAAGFFSVKKGERVVVKAKR